MTKGNKLVAGLVTGAIVGSVIGLLFAPKSGKENRRIVAAGAGEIRQKAGDYVGTLRQKMRRGNIGEVSEEPSDNHVEIAGG